MKRIVSLLLCLVLLCPVMIFASADGITVYAPVQTVRPGQAVILSFETGAAGTASLYIADEAGSPVSVITEHCEARAGRNDLYWNGTWQGVSAPEGSWSLVVELNGETAQAPIMIGQPAPALTAIDRDTEALAPGMTLTVSAQANMDGMLTLGILMDDGITVLEQAAAAQGEASVTWDGTLYGAYMPDGLYTLMVWLTDDEGCSSDQTAMTTALVGFDAAVAESAGIDPELPEDAAGDNPAAETYDEGSDEAFDESFDETIDEAFDEAEDTGAAEDAPHAEGLGSLAAQSEDLMLETVDGDLAEEVYDVLDPSEYTPSYGSPYAQDAGNSSFWTTPMDITDTERIWNMLMEPITVVDNGKKNAEKTQVLLRAEPDEDSRAVGVVTCITQGVRVIREENGWTLVECYSSSFHGTSVEAWNMLVQGWVPSKYLKTTKPTTKRAIIIDKLTQRLYIFQNGELYDTLLVSTGLANERQPYNETRSGEFLLTSAVGRFGSDNLLCAMAIRFNNGDLLHEVPYTLNRDGSKNYKNCEPKLGTKASHGCIRVQRRKTPKGTNMTWLWDNRTKNTKIVIWEDWQGRQIPYPADDTVLYYNSKGGELYHTAETCYAAKGKTFEPFTYGELDEGDFASLTRCDYCCAPLRKAEIDAINEAYVPGLDHDPVMTAAREKYLKSIEE